MKRNDVKYMEKSRNYYVAQGYERAYQWARHDEVPFTIPLKALSESRITFVTTAMPDAGFAGARQLCKRKTDDIPESFFTDELSWDKQATHTDDVGSFFPLQLSTKLVKEGALGSLAEHYYCVPTEYSQRKTRQEDAPNIVTSCLQDQVDLVLLVPL